LEAPNECTENGGGEREESEVSGKLGGEGEKQAWKPSLTHLDLKKLARRGVVGGGWSDLRHSSDGLSNYG